MSEENHYATHFVVTNPPEEGFDQLFYYTAKDKTLKEGKFYRFKKSILFNF